MMERSFFLLHPLHLLATIYLPPTNPYLKEIVEKTRDLLQTQMTSLIFSQDNHSIYLLYFRSSSFT